MRKLRLIRNEFLNPSVIIGLFLSAVVFVLLFFLFKDYSFSHSTTMEKKHVVVKITLKTLKDNFFKLYYDNGNSWNEQDMRSAKVMAADSFQQLVFNIPPDENIKYLRFQSGNFPGRFDVKEITLSCNGNKKTWNSNDIVSDFMPLYQIDSFNSDGSQVHIVTRGMDPYLLFPNNIKGIIKSLCFMPEQKLFVIVLSLLFSMLFFLVIHITRFFSRVIHSGIYDNFLPGFSRFNLLLILVFLSFILLPFLNRVVGIAPMSQNMEKRILTPKPKFLFSKAFDYPKKYSAYFNDHFGFRNLLVFCNSYFKINFFRTSPMPDKAVLGKDGWLFFSNPGVVATCRHTNLFTEQELLKIKNILEKRAAWIKLKGAHYYILMPPDKNTVYPEYIPPQIKPKFPVSRMDQLQEYMEKNSFVHIIDLRNIFRIAKKERVIYYKTDTHWNTYGAFLGYSELIKIIKADFPSIQPCRLDDFKILNFQLHGGDLAQMLELSDFMVRDEIILTPKRNFSAININPPRYSTGEVFNYPVVARDIPGSKLPAMIMFMDSYANLFIPFISENFRRSVYVWSPNFNTAIIEYEKPDVVVHEILERHIDDLLLENPGTVDRDLEATQNSVKMKK